MMFQTRLADAVLFHWRIQTVCRMGNTEHDIQHMAFGRIWTDNKGRFQPDAEIHTSLLCKMEGNLVQTLNSVYELYGFGVHQFTVLNHQGQLLEHYFRLYQQEELIHADLLNLDPNHLQGYQVKR